MSILCPHFEVHFVRERERDAMFKEEIKTIIGIGGERQRGRGRERSWSAWEKKRGREKHKFE